MILSLGIKPLLRLFLPISASGPNRRKMTGNRERLRGSGKLITWIPSTEIVCDKRLTSLFESSRPVLVERTAHAAKKDWPAEKN